MKIIDVTQNEGEKLDEQAKHCLLKGPIEGLRKTVKENVDLMKNRKVWMVNSTSTGGGVAELVPRYINIMRDLGIDCDWCVIQVDNQEFFNLTKRIHKTIQGFSDPDCQKEYTDKDREVFESILKGNADPFIEKVKENDIIIIHDPQPLSLMIPLRKRFGNKISIIWRYHVQFDETVKSSRKAWDFLLPYIKQADHSVFSVKEYVPKELEGKATVIPPGLSPIADKNMDLSLKEAFNILRKSGISPTDGNDRFFEPFPYQAKILLPNGEWGSPAKTNLGLLSSPVITQISRWDPLKGWDSLLRAFIQLKESVDAQGNEGLSECSKSIIRSCKLVLAGPDPAFVKDDPEGTKVLEDLKKLYFSLPHKLQEDVAIINLPMEDIPLNAKIVNAIQRASSIIVQNSLKEGFGLTVAEAMWKSVPVVVSGYCPGLTAQIRDDIEGRVVLGPDTEYDATKYQNELVKILGELIVDDAYRKRLGLNAQTRIREVFLTHIAIGKWISLIAKVARGSSSVEHS